MVKPPKPLKALFWEGDSKEVLREWPKEIRVDFGGSLLELQLGQEPSMVSRPFTSIETGVFELKDGDEALWYRVMYYTRIKDAIHVLHCFAKQSRKTAQRDINAATERLKRLEANEAQRKQK